MFGTDRRIEDITLSVYPALDGDDKICRVLGDVSYTTESDFRDETSEDYIVFAVYISAERFSYIASKIDRKALDGGTFRVDGVSGFYSDWSPSISTYHVKVLTDDAKNHPVEVPAGCAIDPPRLGAVGQFDLTLWSEPLQPSAGNDSRVDGDDYDKSAKQSRDIAARQPVSNTDAATLSILKSLRMAAWIIAGLLFVVAIK